MRYITPKFIAEWRALIREKGIKAFLKEKGWKFVLAIVLFYFVRDTLLYIVIPLLVLNQFPSCQ